MEFNEGYRVFNDITKVERRYNRLVILSLTFMFVCFLLCTYVVFRVNESAKNSFYLLDGGQKLAAVRIKDYKRAIDILCEGHVAIFHELFFGLEPDLRFIKRNIEGKALYMVDRSGMRLYNRLVDQNYYEDIAKSGYSIELERDSIIIDYASYPFRFRFTGKQKIEKDGKTEYRNLITTGYIIETQSTANNLNGLKIIRFDVLDNKDLRK
jgi:conjugative transposon TraK protein